MSGAWGMKKPILVLECLTTTFPSSLRMQITVVKRLNFQYLWVDRYCIDQNGEDKDHQIRNMDLIYRGAELTIIAAAGEDPSFGLPGISSSDRTPQPTIRVKGHVLVSSLPDPAEEMRSSKWASRGWTYQEGLLSRRRLVFTKSQVLFQCMNMHCWETISAPLHIMHTKDLKRFRDGITGCRAFPPRGIGKTHLDLLERIGEYSQKELSFENDFLNAFLGVFHAYERTGVPTNHVTGIPSIPVRTDRNGRLLFKTYQSIAVGLSWFVSWRDGNFLKRRGGFPTWSWVGWSGSGLQYCSISMNEHNRREDLIDIVVELEDSSDH